MQEPIKVCTFLCLLSLFQQGNAQTTSEAVMQQRLEANPSHYSQWERKQSLRALAIQSNQDVVTSPVIYVTPAILNTAPAAELTDEQKIRSSVVGSDLVAMGTIKSSQSAFTEGEGFVFTDHQFLVEEVLAHNPHPPSSQHVSAGEEITLTRAGGTIKVESHLVSSSLPHVRGLENNHRYVLFLRFVPSSHSYEPIQDLGYDITAEPIVALHDSEHPPFQKLFAQPGLFLSSIKSACDRIVNGEMKGISRITSFAHCYGGGQTPAPGYISNVCQAPKQTC